MSAQSADSPVDASLEAARHAALSAMLVAYDRDFIDAYALVIAECQELPEQMNNEIRNAFAHLSRIWAADSVDVLQDEKSKGLGHIHRATRDCLKYTVVHIHKRLQTQHKWARILHKTVNPDFCARSNRIKEEIKKITVQETRGAATEADWCSLIEECKRLSDAYHDQYGIEFAATPLTQAGYILRANALPLAIGGAGWVLARVIWPELAGMLGKLF